MEKTTTCLKTQNCSASPVTRKKPLVLDWTALSTRPTMTAQQSSVTIPHAAKDYEECPPRPNHTLGPVENQNGGRCQKTIDYGNQG